MRLPPVQPYRPYWLFRFYAFVNRLPIPGWALCLLIIIGLGVANHVIAWNQGYLPFGRVDGYLSTVGLYLVLMPAMYAFSSRRAQAALASFFEGSGKSRDKVNAFISDFNSLPDWLTVLLLVIGAIQGYVLYSTMTVVQIPLSAQVLPKLSMLSWLSTSGFLYPVLVRAVRQLVLIKKLFAGMEVDLFNRQPIYTLSRFASLFSIVGLIIMYGFQSIAFPELLFTPFGIALQLLSLTLALAMFIIPLTDISRTLRKAKDKLLAELGKDLKTIQQRVHKSVSSGKLTDISDLRNAVSALKEEMEVVNKIPTWPWQPDTVRNLFTPLLIPVIVYLIQRFLGGLFGL